MQKKKEGSVVPFSSVLLCIVCVFVQICTVQLQTMYNTNMIDASRLQNERQTAKMPHLLKFFFFSCCTDVGGWGPFVRSISISFVYCSTTTACENQAQDRHRQPTTTATLVMQAGQGQVTLQDPCQISDVKELIPTLSQELIGAHTSLGVCQCQTKESQTESSERH